jgi:hypothetical protein
MHSWYAIFNYTEGAVWWLIGAVAAWRAREKSPPQKSALRAAAAILLVFGITDWLEAPRENSIPPWLWALKIACGAGWTAAPTA